jgi:hypothetical protein
LVFQTFHKEKPRAWQYVRGVGRTLAGMEGGEILKNGPLHDVDEIDARSDYIFTWCSKMGRPTKPPEILV